MNRFILVLVIFLQLSAAVSAETLNEAWSIALQVNNQLRSEGHRVEAVRAEHQAAHAARNPVLTNNTAYVALGNQQKFRMETPAMPPVLPSMQYELPMMEQSFATTSTMVSVPLYMGGKIRAGINATSHQVRAAEAGYVSSSQNIKLEVAEAYFNVLRARQLLLVAYETRNSLQHHREDVEKLLQQNMVTRNALLAAQTAEAAAAQDFLKAENLVLIAESAYNRYMGRSLDTPVRIEEMPIPPSSNDLDHLVHSAMHYRQELSEVAAKSQASAAMSRVAHADRLPHVVAMGGHSYLQNSHLSQESMWGGGVGLQWTPFDGGVSRAKAEAALQNAAAAARMRDEIRSLIELQVRSAWTTEQETRNRILVAEQGKMQADENLRVVTRQFQEGLINHTEVLDAQTLQTAAAMNLCHAIYDAIVATYRLRRSIGLLNDY